MKDKSLAIFTGVEKCLYAMRRAMVPHASVNGARKIHNEGDCELSVHQIIGAPPTDAWKAHKFFSVLLMDILWDKKNNFPKINMTYTNIEKWLSWY